MYTPLSKHESQPEIESLFDQHYSELYRLAYRTLDDAIEADDAAQCTFINAYRSLDNFRGDAQAKTWLFRICINECNRRLRRRKFTYHLEDFTNWLRDPQQTSSLECKTMERERNEQVLRAVKNLPTKQNNVIILHYVSGMKFVEIAEVLKISSNTVYSRHAHALKTLRVTLGSNADALLSSMSTA